MLREVLILVLMEYALWPLRVSGRSSPTVKSLNPCSNGICSLTVLNSRLSFWQMKVLILVLMEYALWLPRHSCGRHYCSCVLILVLMEYALWQLQPSTCKVMSRCLNPCSNGICSLTRIAYFSLQELFMVLILVLMEYALWPRSPTWYEDRQDASYSLF